MKAISSNLLTTAIIFGAASLIAASVAFGSVGNQNVSAGYETNAMLRHDGASVKHAVKFLKLSQTHADICLQNEQQCLSGCDGAQSCSNQCEVNYQGCMDQGG